MHKRTHDHHTPQEPKINAFLIFVAPALIPAVSDAIRTTSKLITAGPRALPTNVDDQIRLMRADVERLSRLASIDTPPGHLSQWVCDFRASFRYLAILIVIVATVLGAFLGINQPALDYLFDITAASLSFITGERMYLRLRQ